MVWAEEHLQASSFVPLNQPNVVPGSGVEGTASGDDGDIHCDGHIDES